MTLRYRIALLLAAVACSGASAVAVAAGSDKGAGTAKFCGYIFDSEYYLAEDMQSPLVMATYAVHPSSLEAACSVAVNHMGMQLDPDAASTKKVACENGGWFAAAGIGEAVNTLGCRGASKSEIEQKVMARCKKENPGGDCKLVYSAFNNGNTCYGYAVDQNASKGTFYELFRMGIDNYERHSDGSFSQSDCR